MLNGAARRGYFRLDRVTNKEVNTSRHGYVMRQIKIHDAPAALKDFLLRLWGGPGGLGKSLSWP